MANGNSQNIDSPISRKTPTSIAIDRIMSKKFSDWPKWITLFLLILSLAIGAVMWATNSHASIKSWTAGQDYVTKEELKDTMKEQYVPLHRFTKVEQILKEQGKDLDKIEEKVDKILDKL